MSRCSKGMALYLLRTLRTVDYYEYMDCDGDEVADEWVARIMDEPQSLIDHINMCLSD